MSQAPTRFRSDAFWSSAGILLPVVAAAAATPFLLAALGVERFAIYALALAMVSFAPSFDAGVSRTAFRRVAAAIDRDADERTALTASVLARSWWVGVVAMGVLAVALAALSIWGALRSATPQGALWPMLIALSTVPFAIVTNTQRAVLEGARLFRASAGVRIALGLLTALVPPFLCLFTRNVSVLCLSLFLLRGATLVYQQRLMRREDLIRSREQTERGRKTIPARQGEPTFWQESTWYAVSAPASLVMSGFDRFAILAVSSISLAELSAFLAPQDVALRAIILPAAIIPALMVRIASTANDISGTAGVESERFLMRRVFLSVCAVVFALCLVVSVFVRPLTDAVFQSLPTSEVTLVVQILAVGIFSNAVAQFPAAALNGRGYSVLPAALQLIELPVYLLVLPGLLRAFGPTGAAFAWSGRIVVDTILLLLCADRRTTAFSVKGWHLVHVAGASLLIFLIGHTLA